MEIHATKQVSNLQWGCWDFLHVVSTQEGEDLMVICVVGCVVLVEEATSWGLGERLET